MCSWLEQLGIGLSNAIKALTRFEVTLSSSLYNAFDLPEHCFISSNLFRAIFIFLKTKEGSKFNIMVTLFLKCLKSAKLQCSSYLL